MPGFDFLTPGRTFVIAEAGTGHWETSVERRIGAARSLIDAARLAGADAVKFQIFTKNELLFCPVDGDEKRWEYWAQTILPWDAWRALSGYATVRGVRLLASAFQPEAVAWVEENLVAHKVASRAAKTYPYKGLKKPLIISDGMGLPDSMPGNSKILHCISRYPVGLGEIEIDKMRDGYSSHCPSPWAGIGAIARGAEIVEVHFRYGRFAGPDGKSRDHAVELSHGQLKLVCEARDAFALMR